MQIGKWSITALNNANLFEGDNLYLHKYDLIKVHVLTVTLVGYCNELL